MVFHNDCRFLQRFYQPFQTDKLYFSALEFQVKTCTELKPMNFGYMLQRKKYIYRKVVLAALTIQLSTQLRLFYHAVLCKNLHAKGQVHP